MEKVSSESKHKIKCLQNSLVGAEEYIKKRIEELCDEKKNYQQKR